MKARSRQAPARAAVSRSLPPAPVAAAGATSDAAAPWEHWLDRLPERQRQDLFAAKLPLAAAPPEAVRCGSLPLLVQDLLGGRSTGLPVAPARELPIPIAPPLASRTLQSPDIFLWNRAPNQDVSGPTADVIKNAVRLGWRVLLLAASPASLDRLLTSQSGDSTFLAVRFCGGGERASSGPLKRFSLDEQRSVLNDRLLNRALQERAERDVRRARVQAETKTWESLTATVHDIATLDARERELTQRVARLSEDVRREADALTDDECAATGPFASDFAIMAKAYRARLEACERALLPLRNRRDSNSQSMAAVEREQARLGSLLAPYRAGKWWTISYWRIRFNAELREHAHSVGEQEQLLIDEQNGIASALVNAEAEREAVMAAREVEIRARVAAEVDRRRAEIDQQVQLLRLRRDELSAAWRLIVGQLPQSANRPAEPTTAALDRAYNCWLEDAQADACSDGKDPDPQDVTADFLERMPRLAPVLVGTTLALARHTDFGAAANGPFDLVILDDADRLAESELLAILAKAPRGLAIGSSAAGSSSFAKLWRLLQRTEPASTYQWSRLNDGYLCTLRPLTAADQRFVETERLADFPEIELRIFSAPKSPPRLAQVVFPASLSAVQAKTFIYRELEEAAVDRVERPKKFLDTAERFTIAWECPETHSQETVDLEPGLREAICVKDGQITTCHIEFDKSAGWDQAKIHDWLRRHIPTLDAPRTADLTH